MVIHCINCGKLFYFGDSRQNECLSCQSADLEAVATTIIFAGAANDAKMTAKESLPTAPLDSTR